MKKLITLMSMIFIIGGCASIPPEVQLRNFFVQQSSSPNLLNNADNARWVAYGSMKGVVYQDFDNGMRYFSDVPLNTDKSLEIFKQLALEGDQVSIAIMGIIYRQGIFVEQDLERSLEYLVLVKNDYSDASGEYGIALHQQLRKNPKDDVSEELINDMIDSLLLSSTSEYIPALNALSQIFDEGTYVKRDYKKSAEYKNRSKKLIEKKLLLTKNINESRMLANQYAYQASVQEKKFNNMTFLIGLGLLGAMSYNPTYQSCTVGCSPPSTVDLLNWGIL